MAEKVGSQLPLPVAVLPEYGELEEAQRARTGCQSVAYHSPPVLCAAMSSGRSAMVATM